MNVGTINVAQRSSCVRQICLAALVMVAPCIARAQAIILSEPTQVTLASSLNESSRMVLTATVMTRSGGGVPGGTIQFIDETTMAVLGWADVAKPRIVVAALAAGPHRIRADYSGTSDFLPLVVQPARSAVLISDVTPAPDVNVLSSGNPSVTGQLVTLTAIVICNGGTPNGAVTFRDGADVLASHVGLDHAGRASFTTSALADGSRAITVEYEGDGAHARTVSPRLVQDVGAVRSRSSQLDQ